MYEFLVQKPNGEICCKEQKFEIKDKNNEEKKKRNPYSFKNNKN